MIKIISDSTCDLSPELLIKYNISILPLHIVLEEIEFDDGRDIHPDEIYMWSDANKTTPKTSAPSLEDAISLFRPFVEKGDEIICFSISKEMSTSYNIMRLAAEELDAQDRIHLVDSANLSTGVGLLVVEAAHMIKKGFTVSQILQKMEEFKPKVRASFVVDTLTYLHRGGRCSAVAALTGGMLKLHPKIIVKDGNMGLGQKYRGKMDSVIMNYAKDLEKDLLLARPERVFITHSGCDEEVIQSVKSYLSSLHIFKEICITRAEGVISSHCGKGTLGVLFILQ